MCTGLIWLRFVFIAEVIAIAAAVRVVADVALAPPPAGPPVVEESLACGRLAPTAIDFACDLLLRVSE